MLLLASLAAAQGVDIPYVYTPAKPPSAQALNEDFYYLTGQVKQVKAAVRGLISHGTTPGISITCPPNSTLQNIVWVNGIATSGTCVPNTPTTPTSYVLKSPDGRTAWLVTISNAGVLSDSYVAPLPADPTSLPLDSVDRFGYTLSVEDNGCLRTDPAPYSAAAPTVLPLAAPNGGLWRVTVDDAGPLRTEI